VAIPAILEEIEAAAAAGLLGSVWILKVCIGRAIDGGTFQREFTVSR